MKMQKPLLKWFDSYQRDLPWRKKKTRYRIWVSEIMLQQTQVATVVDYYRRFMKRFPTVKKLAAADQADVLKMWEGLGYYRRARQLHAAAQVIVENHGGRFPREFESVLALPGIGRYTAGAILSIADDQRLPILEGNTIRLFARLLEMRDDPRSTANQKRLWEFAESILPENRTGDFNQALMELGSLVCQPKNPRCESCPLSNDCPTFVKGLQTKIPATRKKIEYEEISEAVVLVQRRSRFLVRQCAAGERWAGLWDFPRYAIDDKAGDKTHSLAQVAQQLQQQLKLATGLNADISAASGPVGTRIKHTVTRYRITLDCFKATTVSGRLKQNGSAMSWVTPGQLSELPMSVTGRKIAQRIKSARIKIEE